jgi:hypothetical protein
MAGNARYTNSFSVYGVLLRGCVVFKPVKKRGEKIFEILNAFSIGIKVKMRSPTFLVHDRDRETERV